MTQPRIAERSATRWTSEGARGGETVGPLSGTGRLLPAPWARGVAASAARPCSVPHPHPHLPPHPRCPSSSTHSHLIYPQVAPLSHLVFVLLLEQVRGLELRKLGDALEAHVAAEDAIDKTAHRGELERTVQEREA